MLPGEMDREEIESRKETEPSASEVCEIMNRYQKGRKP